uniref:(northern house mosquito) hypothetical protein n=1 Tax=Culex pipiens TaxID=7175 RepID=A0A8D8CQE1_CULPI
MAEFQRSSSPFFPGRQQVRGSIRRCVGTPIGLELFRFVCADLNQGFDAGGHLHTNGMQVSIWGSFLKVSSVLSCRRCRAEGRSHERIFFRRFLDRFSMLWTW